MARSSLQIVPTRTETLDSDKDLLDSLGLSDSDAARVLGRTRQSIYQARIATRIDYFKSEDIRALVYYIKGVHPDIELGAVIDYVARTRSAEAADEIAHINEVDAKTETLREYRELWIVLPDPAWMNQTYPDLVDWLIGLGTGSNQLVRYFVSAVFDRASLVAELERRGARAAYVWSEAWMGAIPPIILGDPMGKGDTFLLSGGRFSKNDWYGGRNLAMLIQTLVDRKPNPSPIETIVFPALDADNGQAGQVRQGDGLGAVYNDTAEGI